MERLKGTETSVKYKFLSYHYIYSHIVRELELSLCYVMDFIGLSLRSERTILGCRLGFLQHVVVSPKQKKLSAVFEEVLLLLLINNHVL